MVESNRIKDWNQYGELVLASVSEKDAIKTGLTRQRPATDKGILNDA